MEVNLGPFKRICSIHQLELAFRVVKRKGVAPGIDGVTIESFEKNLLEEITRLNEEVESWSYQPSL
jgi:retron-type reverse transcriptase